MKTDIEIRKTFKVFSEKDDTIEMIFLERQEDKKDELRQAQLMMDEMDDLISFLNKNSERKFLFLIDLVAMGKVNYVMGRDARSYYKENLVPEKIKKMAIITESTVIRTLAKFVLMAIRQKNISFFDSRKKALDWLKKV